MGALLIKSYRKRRFEAIKAPSAAPAANRVRIRRRPERRRATRAPGWPADHHAHTLRMMEPAFNPTFRIRGAKVVLHPLEMVSVPVDRLGPPVGSLADEGQAIIGALDELFSRTCK